MISAVSFEHYASPKTSGCLILNRDQTEENLLNRACEMFSEIYEDLELLNTKESDVANYG